MPIVEAGDNLMSPRQSARLPRVRRLNKAAVSEVLKQGKRIRAAISLLPSPATVAIGAKQQKPIAKFSAKAHVPVGVGATNLDKLAGDHAAHQPCGFARVAIAVPKRLLKSAVSRNTVKRWIREAFRQHPMREQRVDMLITLESKLDLKSGAERQAARQELQGLLSEAQRRLPAAPQSLGVS